MKSLLAITSTLLICVGLCGCAPPRSHVVTGTLTSVELDAWSNQKYELVFENGTTCTVVNDNSFPFYVNQEIRLEYRAGCYPVIQSIAPISQENPPRQNPSKID